MLPEPVAVPKPCPWCLARGGLTIGVTLAAKPLGTWSLAGVQPKTVATQRVVLSCTACTSYALGYIDGDGDFAAEQVFNRAAQPE